MLCICIFIVIVGDFFWWWRFRYYLFICEYVMCLFCCFVSKSPVQ